jgi:hypothetical protein
VLYELDGREMDEVGLDPFLRLPTMCEVRLELETEKKVRTGFKTCSALGIYETSYDNLTINIKNEVS